MSTIGSARHDENGRYVGGKKGDQTGSEVSTQKYYNHKKTWNVYRAKNVEHRRRIAERMQRACDNNHIGYNQWDRYSLSALCIDTAINCNTDCSELMRVVVREATGCDIGPCTTANIGKLLLKTGLFELVGNTGHNLKEKDLMTGDILCTATKGHVVAVTKGDKQYEQKGLGVTNKIAPKPYLRYGSKGQKVSTLQQALNEVLGSKLDIDGDFGVLTREILVAFQEKYGLEPDGEYGPLTQAKLQEVWK